MSDYDSPWKEALDFYFEAFVAFFSPEAHADIDWARGYEFLDKEFQKIAHDAEVGRCTVDKLVKVWLASGEEQWVLIHIEIQVTEEGGFPRRMYIYHYRSFDMYNKEVVSLAVLGDDNPRWRPDHFQYARWGCRAGLWFPVVKLLDYADQTEALERNPNPFATVVLAHLKTLQTRQDQGQRYASKIGLVKGLYDRGWAAKDVRQLFRLIDWIMDIPEALEETLWEQIKSYEEEKHMPFVTTPERVGIKKGLSKGIEAVLRVRFGEEGLRLMPEVQEIHNQEKLEAVLQAAQTVASPEDLRRMWAE